MLFCRGTKQHRAQITIVGQWKRYLNFDVTNDLSLGTFSPFLFLYLIERAILHKIHPSKKWFSAGKLMCRAAKQHRA